MKANLPQIPARALCWGLSEEDEKALGLVLGAADVACIPVPPGRLDCKVGELLEGRGEESPAPPKELPEPPCLVLDGVEGQTLQSLLGTLRQIGVVIPLKAMATPTNRGWSFLELHRELCREHAELTGSNPSIKA